MLWKAASHLVNVYPHDPSAFTQGLVYREGVLFESTGLNGYSTLRKVELSTGKVVKVHRLGAEHFGEGLAILGNRAYQLTWYSEMGFVYDIDSFEILQTFPYGHEGWGLSTDGHHLIVSDGTHLLRFWDSANFGLVKTLDVTHNGRALSRVNELQYVNGSIFANVWGTDSIVRIDAQTGQTTGIIDLSDLLTPTERMSVDVANGIAYIEETGNLLVTGKLWPRLFEIDVVRA